MLPAIDAAARRVERDWKCLVLKDSIVADEVVKVAEDDLNRIKGVPSPNAFKIAGHYTFWIRKLKPFRIFDLDDMQAMLMAMGYSYKLNADKLNDNILSAADPRRLIVNELIAVKVGIAIIEEDGHVLRWNPELINDLIESLRYHSHSASAIRMFYEGMLEVPSA